MTITAELRQRYAAARREATKRAPRHTTRSSAHREMNALIDESRERTERVLARVRANRSGRGRGPDALDLDTIARQDARINALQRRLTDQVTGSYGGRSEMRRGAHALQGNYRSAFHAWFRTGNASQIQAAASTQSSPDGGFLVPHEMAQEIDRVLTTVSAVRSLATVRQISTNEFQKRVSKGGAKSGWVAEEEARPSTETPVVDRLSFNAMELYAMPEATQALLEDAEINIESWLAEEVATEFADQEGDAFVNGDGSGKPRGLLAYPTVANSAFKWGKIGFIASGKSDGLADTDPADKLIDLVYGLNRKWRQSARWLMNDFTAAEVRKIKDGDGIYIWERSVQAGEPNMLLGYPVEFDDNMPDIAANKFAMAFGDFRRAYLIVDRRGVNVLRDPYTNKPNVRFYTTKRVGGGIQDFEAVKLFKIAAS